MMERSESLAQKFYQCLFEFEPLLRPMFKKPFELQEKHFDLVINAAVENINNPDALLPELEELGKKHQGKGIINEHFLLVKSAFMLAIDNILGGQFTRESRQAWEKYIDQISNVIKQKI